MRIAGGHDRCSPTILVEKEGISMSKPQGGMTVGPLTSASVRSARGAVVVAAMAWIAGCGGGGDRVTNPPVTPTPGPVLSVVGQGNFTLSAPDEESSFFIRRVFNTSASGVLETTVDWTYATNTLLMYLAEGECTSDQFASDDCPGPACACRFSVTSEQAAPKPRVLSLANASAGTRTLIVWNIGPREDAGSYQAVLTSAGVALKASSINESGAEMVAKRRKTAR
jgi:hypothetical protein